ncbi:MAG: mitomycin resistance protein [Gammaproteobacteria bacterium]|nr:MAG: mitomycin resistance protein [Gammaproteobacteria bacterium]
MKNPDRKKVSRLDALPNIGKAIMTDLHLINIDHPKQLIGMEPLKMYEDLCAVTGKKHDLCVLDVFISAVHFMEGGEPLPWWSFTQERKKYLARLASLKPKDDV